MALIRVKDLKLRTYIGFADHELEKKQDVIINLTFRYDARACEQTDNADDALNYRSITKRVIAHVEDNRFFLLEKLTREILEIIAGYPEVQEATVEVDKPHALRFAESVSVEEHFIR